MLGPSYSRDLWDGLLGPQRLVETHEHDDARRDEVEFALRELLPDRMLVHHPQLHIGDRDARHTLAAE